MGQMGAACLRKRERGPLWDPFSKVEPCSLALPASSRNLEHHGEDGDDVEQTSLHVRTSVRIEKGVSI